MIRVVNRKNANFDLYIGRGTKWGNPFVIGKDGNRNQVILKYETLILNDTHLMNSLHELDGLVLGCSCKPLPCHGDVLIKLRNEQKNNLLTY